ncbi:unnamed protein product [Arctia plantaginis]|uniref:Uncharacterized protein n=1 Tax=Arctia plantaginis TaxID=874455 RepID=A0A8S1BIA3_ARCPL|nr:unnamed protein product [Arctia plantaginis]
MLLKTIFVVISISSAISRHADLRDYYFNSRRVNKLIADRAKVLEVNLPKNREYLDGIAHYKKRDLSSKDVEKVTAIENDFRRLIAMKGVKYVYKRNMHWRTWRKVKIDNGVTKIVSYKCNNNLRKNTTGCDNCGSWTLEESPPCPVEIYSIIDDSWICVHDYLQPLEDFNDNCPSMIKFTDLPPTCDNPTDTIYRFTTDFDAAGKHNNIICEGKYYCEVLTTYLISKTNISFRIINSENKILYSKIMKKNNINYMCVKDCGHYDPRTKTVTKIDKPMKLSLLTSRKNKRDLIGQKESEDVIDNQLSMPNDEHVEEVFHINAPSKTVDTKKMEFLLFMEDNY